MDFNTPVGRLVQGSVALSKQKDMDTNQFIKNDDGTDMLGVFFALAFPKVLPTGQQNTEFLQFFGTLKQTAAEAWPALFPQGAGGNCINPRFSWKFQDGDGVDQSGKSVADKPGFKGHYIVKFYTSYPVRCFHEGKFAAHEEIQKPEEIIKRGHWVRVFGEMKSNMATGTQVPGVSLYPKLVSFVERGEEIKGGPDAEQAFGSAAVGWRPPASASPIALPGAGTALPGAGTVLPTPPGLTLPGAAAAPTYVLTPALVQAGHKLDVLLSQGHTIESLLAAGHITVAPPPLALTPPAITMPGSTAPPVITLPGIGGPPPLTLTPPAPTYVLTPAAAATGATIKGLLDQGWTYDLLVQHGHVTKV